ncbi:MAG: hypothetical protein AMS24_03345 [Chlamydiae bacterium SM23_39]|nr:MAG: hypothetical protein AMS24_03345 [Chlamydiae bacterium SM23_39]
MKKLIITLLCFFSILFSMNDDYKYKSRAAAASSSNTISTSMAVWGIGLTVGISIIYILMKSSTSEE